MPYFAQVTNNLVTQVISIDQETLNTGHWGDPATWVQTSYNTRGGVHYGPDGKPDGGVALRKNYAGIGYTYDPVLDAFIPPQPYPSWLLNTQTGLWDPPIPYPNDGKTYVWDEATRSWVEVPFKDPAPADPPV